MVSTIDFFKPILWRSNCFKTGCIVHVRGYMHGKGFEEKLFTRICKNKQSLADFCHSLDGHFSAIVELDDYLYLISDKVMSIPLFYAWDGQNWKISDNGGQLARDLGLTVNDINPDGALAIAMAGYTIGTDTLYSQLKVVGSGQVVVLGPKKSEENILTYYKYTPWDVEDKSDKVLQKELRDITLSLLEKMIESVKGRTIIVALSAGLDSRLIVSGLKHLAYENVKCFSYGIPHNHEAIAAKKISAKLGYPWRFVPYHIGEMRKYFCSKFHEDYLIFADSCISVPFEQDLPAVRTLLKDNYIKSKDVLVNGNSGDFISGNHILNPFHTLSLELDAGERKELVLKNLVFKHFRLWKAVGTLENDKRIKSRLEKEIIGPLDNPHKVHGIYEYMEMIDRQCKYVISGQRSYDYMGLDWRLPLWDDDYLFFWSKIPLRAKLRQVLYKEMLYNCNWGGVWNEEVWNFPKNIVPLWVRLIRDVLKVMHVPLGQEAWHNFERRYLDYWISTLRGYSARPYLDIANDSRGHRNAVSFYADSYLTSKGLEYKAEKCNWTPKN